MINQKKIIRIEKLRKLFPAGAGLSSIFKQELFVHAVDGITLDVTEGENFGLVGETGCGKTTLGKVLVGLLTPTEGEIYYRDRSIFSLRKNEFKKIRSKIQMIFQDPYKSLNFRFNIRQILSEPLTANKLVLDRDELEKRITGMLSNVGLMPPERFLYRRPYELSGGQRQRVCIARSLIVNPDFIVADEPVSMLDSSIRAGVIEVLQNQIKERNLTLFFITHDIALTRHICDRIAIMYLGKIVEFSPMEKIAQNPLHPYTIALWAAVPSPDLSEHIKVLASGDIPNPINVPKGCRFYPRCTYAKDTCKNEDPELIEIEKGHFVACHVINK